MFQFIKLLYFQLTTSMEEIISRFPHMAEQIFEELDNYHFIQCKVISPSWKNFMEGSKFSYTRSIKASTNCSKKTMKKFSKKTNSEDTVQFASDVNKLYDELQIAKFQFKLKKKKRYVVIDDSSTIFHMAAKRGSMSVCQLMLDSIEDEHHQCGKRFRGVTPLSENVHASICKLIVFPIDFIGNTPLHMAAEYGHLSVCELLISWFERAFPEAIELEHTNAENNSGYTPLHKAAENGHLSVCQFLIGKIEDKNVKEGFGLTPLSCAARKGHSAICHLLIESLVNVNICNVDRKTALHFAAENNLLSVCQKLMAICIDHKPMDKDGNTPFHLAARKGHQKVCQLFSESGYLSEDSMLGSGYLVSWGDGPSKKIKLS